LLLQQKVQHKALRPRLDKKFACIGPKCEDSCCSGWTVHVDRQSFESYKALPESPLRPLFEERLVVNVQSKTDRDFSIIQLNPDGACPFLSAEKLCSIQTTHGADHLSTACATYPRRMRIIDNVSETSLELSCPEAARVVLLDPHFMPLRKVAASGHGRYTPFVRVVRELDLPNGNPYQYLWEIREFLLLVLKDRSYPLWQRLFVVGMFCQRLTQVTTPVEGEAEGARGTIPRLLEGYGEIMQQSRLRGVMDAIPTNHERQLTLAIQLLDRRVEVTEPPRRILECVREFATGIGYQIGEPIEKAIPGYRQALVTHFQPFLERYEFIFENYLVNTVLRRRFPYGDDVLSTGPTTPTAEFTTMTVEFALIQTLAIGMAGEHGANFGPEHVVRLVQSFSKAFEHSQEVRTSVADFVEHNQLGRTESLAVMLRH